MAFDFVVQRLQIGDVILLGETEATVTRAIEWTESSGRVTSPARRRLEDVVKEWAVGEMVTVVRGP